MQVLVRQALRMRPDRLVVGEVRGARSPTCSPRMNTGHEGGCGTLHANSAADVPARIEALAMAAGLPQAAAHSQLASAVDVVVHLRRERDGARRVAELAVLAAASDGLVAHPARRHLRAGRPSGRGAGRDRLADLLERT